MEGGRSPTMTSLLVAKRSDCVFKSIFLNDVVPRTKEKTRQNKKQRLATKRMDVVIAYAPDVSNLIQPTIISSQCQLEVQTERLLLPFMDIFLSS